MTETLFGLCNPFRRAWILADEFSGIFPGRIRARGPRFAGRAGDHDCPGKHIAGREETRIHQTIEEAEPFHG